MEEARQVQALKEVLDRIAEEFSALDIDGWIEHFQFPSTFVFGAQLVPISTEEDLRALAIALVEALRARGFSRSELETRNIQMLGDGVGIASVVWRRFKEDGSLLERFAVTYTFLRSDDEWRVVFLVTHQPETVLQFG